MSNLAFVTTTKPNPFRAERFPVDLTGAEWRVFDGNTEWCRCDSQARAATIAMVLNLWHTDIVRQMIAHIYGLTGREN